MTEKPKLFERYSSPNWPCLRGRYPDFRVTRELPNGFWQKEVSIKRSINEAWKPVAVGRDTAVTVTADIVWLSIASCLLITLQPYKGLQRSPPKSAASGLVLASCETPILRCLGIWRLSHFCVHWQALRSSMNSSWAGKIRGAWE